MKKLLFQLDTDPTPNIFDTVVAYDGGADHVLSYGNIKPSTVGIIIDVAIFTRPPKMKKNTALFVSGSNIADGEAVLASVRNHFFGDFCVSVMLDSNGSNTTAAVATIGLHANLARKRGRARRDRPGRAARGHDVCIGRRRSDPDLAPRRSSGDCLRGDAQPFRRDSARSGRVLEGANIILATGAAGVELLHEDAWKDLPKLEILMGANATPPLGIQGVDMNNRARALRQTLLRRHWIRFIQTRSSPGLHRAAVRDQRRRARRA